MAAVALIAGCSSSVPASPRAATPEPSESPNPASEIIAAVVDDLGPYSAPAPLTGKAAEDELRETADDFWAEVTEKHPKAVRPEVEVQFVLPSEYREAQRTCLQSAGETLREGLEWESDQSEADDLLQYACRVEFVTEPREGPTDEFLGYLYDVLTQFSVPCLEGEGSTIEAAPSREKFIRKWPNQHWWPTSTRIDEFEADMAKCQPALDEYR